ncbi:MAG: amino acid permease [Thermoanaerobaculia bacterium]
MANDVSTPPSTGSAAAPALARRLGALDATLIVMGGIIGAGIFVNPHVVAQRVAYPAAVLGVWILGGLIAGVGALVYAELGAARPVVGGQYAFLRDAFHPVVAFVYGWSLLLVIQSGGMAAVAITFGRYLKTLVDLPLGEDVLGALLLGVLVLVNLAGVRAGGTLQNVLMVLKVVAIAALIVAGLWVAPAAALAAPPGAPVVPFDPLLALGAAMVPVLFAFNGYQTGAFVAGEMKNPRRDLPRGLLSGVALVVLLYVGVAAACLRVLGAPGLAAEGAPATAVMRAAWGSFGARFIAVGIVLSTAGFLAQNVLTAPRVYFAMARDGVFFRGVGRLSRGTRAPTIAIVLQGAAAAAVALLGRYEQILNYAVSADFIAFALVGVAVFVLRRREGTPAAFRIPGHPWTTIFFVLANAITLVAMTVRFPGNSLTGFGLMLAGVPVYWLWARRGRRP